MLGVCQGVRWKRMEERWKRRDFILLAGLLVCGIMLVGVYGWIRGGTPKTGPVLEVRVDGELVQSYPLDRETDVVLQGVNGGTNHLHIADGQAWLSEASCPDKVCVHMGKISEAGQSIICLPNRMVLEVTGK